jgi:hypothetical protein
MKTSKKTLTKVGDILEIQTPKGLSYVQFIGKHPEYGDAIRVFPGCFKKRIVDSAKLNQSGYIVFYPVQTAVAKGLLDIVGSNPLPLEAKVPRNIRRPGARGRTGEILTWIIEDAKQETVRDKLTEAERKLPIAAIWDHNLLILRLSQGWSPEKEG